MLDIFLQIARGLRAELRETHQSGVLEFIRRDLNIQPVITITEEEIKSVRVLEHVYAAATVRVNYDLGQQTLMEPTGADSGVYSDERLVETALVNFNDVREVIEHEKELYSVDRRIYEIRLHLYADLVLPGTPIIVQHPMVTGSGVVTEVYRKNLSNDDRIEVLI